MRVAFLVGRDSASTRLSVEAVCCVPGAEPVALLLDTSRPTLWRRLRNLRRNVRREGPSYVIRRAVGFLADWLDRRAAHFACVNRAHDLLRTALPDRALHLADLARRHGFRLIPVDDLNSPEAVEALRWSGAKVGIVLGTRILRRSTFSVPELGCINLHKGAVPKYRGLPPGFWELYEGQRHAAVTVHLVDDRLDTGDIVGTREIPIHPCESEQSLRAKLDREGAALLAKCVEDVSRGSFQRTPQRKTGRKPRTNPTQHERIELQRRHPHGPALPSGTHRIIKTAFHLALFYSGIYYMRRFSRRFLRRSRAAILLYHRVNDFSVDALTTSTERFAEHLAMLGRTYEVRGTSWLLDRLEKGDAIPPETVIIHFDDCYRDVRTTAAPLLRAAGMPAAAFIASGFVGTSRQFEHDRTKSPFTHENLSREEVRELLGLGFEIGAHTVNHANLGRTPLREVESEVLQSRKDLEEISGTTVDFFSFPFGRTSDISNEARSFISQAGFRALFSACGGAVAPHSSMFDIPRLGVSSEHRCLDLMMEIQGLSIGDWFRRVSRSAGPPTS